MSKIILLPIEPLEERYSADWFNWFRKELPENTIIVSPITLTDKITSGSFLDVCGTNYYKSMQLATVSRMIHDGVIESGDTFLVLDAWFPGIEMLAYMRDALGLDFKIVGCLHAGTYDPNDFLRKKGMDKWAWDLENSWFKIYDQIFVATEYHKWLVCSNRLLKPSKVKITGFPIHNTPFSLKRRENIVVFPHRLDVEKNPALFDLIADKLKWTYTDWVFIKSKDYCHNKAKYYELLGKASIAVSLADQETWGIAMQEAVLSGCIPIVPNKLSYAEMYPEQFKYNGDYRYCAKMVCDTIHNLNEGEFQDFNALVKLKTKILLDGSNAIPKMIREINS